MAQKYQIEQSGEYYIAHHRDDPLNDVRIDSEWTEEKDDDIRAPWEDLIAAIVSDDITNHIDVSTHHQMGSVGIETAVRNLADKVEEIESEEHADALIHCLLDEGIIDREGDEVVLFQNVSGGADNPNYLYNWAAAIEMARSKIDDQIERAKELDEQLQKDLSEIEDIGQDFVQEDPQEQLERINQKMRSLGDDDGEVPDPDTLSSTEYKEYQQYKRTFQIARSRKRIQERYTVEWNKEGVPDMNELMQGEIQNFQELKQAFIEYEQQLRTTIRANKWRSTNVEKMLDGLIDMIGGIAMLDQGMEDMSHDEIDQALAEMTDSRDQAYDAGRDLTKDVDEEERVESIESQAEDEFQESFRG